VPNLRTDWPAPAPMAADSDLEIVLPEPVVVGEPDAEPGVAPEPDATDAPAQE